MQKFTFISLSVIALRLVVVQNKIARATMQKPMQLLVLFLLGLIHATTSLPPYIIKQHDEREVLFQITSKGNHPRPFKLVCVANGDPPPK